MGPEQEPETGSCCHNLNGISRFFGRLLFGGEDE